MIEDLIQGFDSKVFCALLNAKFSGSFSAVSRSIPVEKDLLWKSAQQLGIVKTLPGPNDLNMPLLIVAVALPEGEELRERSSRIKQFKFAKTVLGAGMSSPAHGIEGLISQGLFVFYDDSGNFRLSLVFGTPKGTKLVLSDPRRQSFYVEAGAVNKTFHDRAKLPWSSFDKLKDAFSVEKLTEEFYRRLFKWYQWALSPEMGVTYPNDTKTDADDRDIGEHIIRLITRLMFVWFLKQKHLVPNDIFDPEALKGILKRFDPSSGDNYYRAILQNLFFATLNSAIPERAFAVEKGNRSEHFDIKTFYRYPKEFSVSEGEVLELFKGIPFLNGGLFECLDRRKDYYDGFSRNRNKRAKVPNILFFDAADGLIPLLSQYNFTVEENSPGDEEVALDPEMLGKVFENLLGAYNPETEVAARKATGSFYTPREIVNYMVDESLIAHLLTTIEPRMGANERESDGTPSGAEQKLRQLFAKKDGNPFNADETAKLDKALVTAKILDPACGSGAFPMGVLLKMVEILRILRDIPEDESVYDLKLELIENCIYGADIQCIAVQISKLRFFISLVCEQKPTSCVKDNYGINPLPNLETKFVAANSLIALPQAGRDVLDLCTGDIASLKEQLFDVRHRHFSAKTFKEKKQLRREDKKLRNSIKRTVRHDAKPDRKRLEMLLQEREKVAQPKWVSERPTVRPVEMFSEFPSTTATQTEFRIDANEKPRKALDADIALEQKKENISATIIDSIAGMLASWDPYNQNKSAPYLDPEWMFNVQDGFDITIGNPPFGVKFSTEEQNELKPKYETFVHRGESYMLFVELSVSLLRREGQMSLIVPDTYLNLTFTKVLRSFLMKNTEVREIVLLPSRAFETATVDTTVLMLCRPDQPKQGRLRARLFNKSDAFVSLAQSMGETIELEPNSLGLDAFNITASSAQTEILVRLEAPGTVVDDVADVFYGIKAYQVGKGKPSQTRSVVVDKLFTSVTCHGEDWLPFYDGKDITRYGLLWRENNWLHYGPWLAEPRTPAKFEGEKLLIRKIVGERLFATYVPYTSYCNTLISVLKLRTGAQFKYKSLLGILNSTLLGWYIRCKLQISAEDTFPQILIGNVRSLPLPIPDNQMIESLGFLVERILTAKNADINADVSALETEIDQLVYKLYDLTPEEIAIVQGNTDTSVSKKSNTDIPVCDRNKKQAGMPVPPSKKPARKQKTALPPSLPGWD